MSIQSKILKDLSKYLPQMIIPSLIAFISIPVYTKIFPPSSYGNLNIVRVSIDILRRFSGWIGLSMLRYYPIYEKEKKLGVMFTSIVKLNFLIGLFIGLPTLLVLNFIKISSELKILFVVGIILFIFGLIYNSLSGVLRITRKINTLSLFALTSSLFGFLISLGLIFIFHFKIESILLGNLIILIILLPFLWRITVSKYFFIKQKINFDIIKKFASYGIPLTVGSLGAWALELSDRYVIKILLGSHEVGVYSACYNVTWNSLFLIVNAFYMMEQPLALKIFVNNGEQALREFINRETRLFIIFMIPCVFLICSYSKIIFSVMVAEEYRTGIIIVPYVASGVLINGLIFKFHLVFLAMEKTKSSMYILIISAASNIVFNILLIPYLGILGAGVGTLFSYLFYFILIVFFSKRIFQWPFPFASFLRVIVISIIAIFPFSFFFREEINLSKIACIVFGSIILYIALLFRTGEIKKNEIAAVKTYLTNRKR